MNNEKTLTLINLYFDGELDKQQEVILFTSLSQDQSARDYFKQLSVIRNAVNNSDRRFPNAELEERILRSVGSKNSVKRGTHYLTSKCFLQFLMLLR
jgi:hypothetical protein